MEDRSVANYERYVLRWRFRHLSQPLKTGKVLPQSTVDTPFYTSLSLHALKKMRGAEGSEGGVCLAPQSSA